MKKRALKSSSTGAKHRHARGGSLYVAVMVVALIVSVIGLSTMTIARLQLQAAQSGVELEEAKVLAQTAVEFAAHKITDIPAWRSVYIHDTWQPAEVLGNGSFQWKLVAASGDLQNPTNGAVSIVGQGTLGGATRRLSVQLNTGDRIVPGSWTRD